MKKSITTSITLIALILLSVVGRIYADQGCCSYNGGQNFCDANGMWMCNDGTESPTCMCSQAYPYAGYAPAGSCPNEKASMDTAKATEDKYSNMYNDILTNLMNQYKGVMPDSSIRVLASKQFYSMQADYQNAIDSYSEAKMAYYLCLNKEGLANYLKIQEENSKTPDQLCQEQYGNSAVSYGSSYCTCSQGYVFNADKTACIQKLSTSTTTTTSTEELSQAISWMYNNGLTIYNTVADFMGNTYLTREQAAKFFVKFANVIGRYDVTPIKNKFTDIRNATPALVPYIGSAYSMGFMNGKNNRFMPFANLTQAQAIATIIRVIWGYQSETGPQWYAQYYSMANNHGMLDGLGFNYNILDSTNILRQDMALLLYRASKLK